MMVKFTRLVSAVEEDAKEQCGMQDLTATQVNYIEIIGELGNPTITELAAVMKLTKPSVTIVVDRLVAKGFVYKMPSDTDKRSSFLHLTELGTHINRWHDNAHNYMIDLIVKKIKKEEVNLFTLLLDKITNDNDEE